MISAFHGVKGKGETMNKRIIGEFQSSQIILFNTVRLYDFVYILRNSWQKKWSLIYVK